MPTTPPTQPGPTATDTTPALPSAPAAPLAPTTPLKPRPAALNNGPAPQNQDDDTDDNTIGPQDSTCTPTGPQTWGPPANDTQVNQVPDRDPSTVQWDISSDCTLTIHHGTTPNYNWRDVPWDSYRARITKIHIDGNLTLHTTNGDYGSGAFQNMSELREVQIDDTLHLSQQAAKFLFYTDSALTAFTGNGTTAIETSQTTNMNSMFEGCSGLTALDVTHFNTTNTTNMFSMFGNCSGLTALDVTHFNTTNTTNMSWMFWNCASLISLDLSSFDTRKSLNNYNPPYGPYGFSAFLSGAFPRDLRLGPLTYLSTHTYGGTGTQQSGLIDTGWVELTASGRRQAINSMMGRTGRSSGRSPAGHYVRPSLIVTIDYNNGQTDHIKTLGFDTNTNGNGAQRITWGARPAHAGKVFDGWDFTTSDPTHVTLTDNTIRWTTGITSITTTAKLTARWRSLDTPALDLNIHADGTPSPGGAPGPWAEITVTTPTPAANGDGVRLESLNGTGRTANCTPTTGTRTCTFRLTIPQLRDASDYDALYRLKASVTGIDRRDTDTTVTGAPTEKQGILPYTTINYLAGTGTGTPPPSDKALTDTSSQTAQIIVAGPSPIMRPTHSLFNTWRSGNGTGVRAGTTPVTTAMGTTDAQGRTTVTLTATWTLLNGPTGTTATRDPATNQVIISGTAKPNTSTDTIRLCHPTAGGGTQCHDTATDTRGNRLPYDGTTEHPWHITLPADTPDGDWSVDTNLTATDPAYPAGSQPVDSPVTRGNVHIPTPYTSTLPLTGGDNRHNLLLTAGALAAAMLLLAAATQLRNRRSRQARHRTAAPAKPGRR